MHSCLRLLGMISQINKLKHANETLSASLMQAQADLEAMLATEAASRAVADAARMALESERHDNAIAMRAMQAELASCKAEIASLHSTAKSAASDKEDINEQVNLLNKEIGAALYHIRTALVCVRVCELRDATWLQCFCARVCKHSLPRTTASVTMPRRPTSLSTPCLRCRARRSKCGRS